jgi:L-2-hydroxyglutarate oxidase
MSLNCDLTVIGGGIVGMATALALSEQTGVSLTVLEAEEHLAAHQTGHNSGVIHSGLYYKPGSAKARNCAEGRELLYRFCAENGVPHDRCGKVVVATTEREMPALLELQRRGQANGLESLTLLDARALREHEPHVRGIAGLHVKETGIVDYRAVTEAYGRHVRQRDGQIVVGARVRQVRRLGDELVVVTSREEIRTRYLINCSGLQADRIARLC